MSSQSICHCCHSPQVIQRVAAIVAGGIQKIRVITAELQQELHTALAHIVAAHA